MKNDYVFYFSIDVTQENEIFMISAATMETREYFITIWKHC